MFSLHLDTLPLSIETKFAVGFLLMCLSQIRLLLCKTLKSLHLEGVRGSSLRWRGAKEAIETKQEDLKRQVGN